MKDKIKHILELDAKRTQGIWLEPHIVDDEVTCNCKWILAEGYCGSVCEISVDNGKLVGEGGNDSPPLEEAKANAQFIALAPTMVEIIKELQADIQRLKDIALREITKSQDSIAKIGALQDAFIEETEKVVEAESELERLDATLTAKIDAAVEALEKISNVKCGWCYHRDTAQQALKELRGEDD